MFRHKGNSRTFQHNVSLAVSLSLIAGMVNVSGVLALKTLTTNVTGHFAFFAEEIVNERYSDALIFAFFILSFLFGAFSSGLLIEISERYKFYFSYAVPMVIEVALLVIVGVWGNQPLFIHHPHFVAYILLFAMGLQNALVTQISKSTVRTTHLTGLFTDLGIEISQLFFYTDKIDSTRLKQSVLLRLTIIVSFFLGCIIGGFMFREIELKTVLVAACLLSLAVTLDNIRIYYYIFKRKVVSAIGKETKQTES